MKVEYVSPFVEAAVSVLGQVIGAASTRGSLSVKPQTFTSEQINIVCEIVGPIQGQVLYGMSQLTAIRIASQMMGGEKLTMFDTLAASAVAELGNMISGNALTLLSSSGYACDISPPNIIQGANVRCCKVELPALVIPITIPNTGTIEIKVSLQEDRSQIAA